MNFLGGGRGLIGLDVDGRFIKAAQLRGPARRWSLAAALVLPKSDPAAPVSRTDVEQLRGALARQGFEGRRVALAVPEEKIVTGMLELPPRASGAPLEDIARTELATMHGYDPQAAEAAMWDLPASTRVKDATHAMAVAVRHADAEALLAVFEDAGLEIVALESRMDGLARAFGPLLRSAGITAILELEWNGAILNLWYGGVVIYRWMAVTAGLRQLSAALAASLQLDPDQVNCLISDVGLAPAAGDGSSGYEVAATVMRRHFDAAAAAMESPLSYATQQYPEAAVDAILLAGPGAAVPGIDEFFKARLGAAVRRVMPVDMVACPVPLGGKERDPSLAVAVGMAQARE